MNNERLQFRAWDGIQMWYSNEKGNVIVVSSGGWELGNQDYDWEVYGTSSYNNDILMQCTGLRDKNNNLIWEGDILKKKYMEYDELPEEYNPIKEWPPPSIEKEKIDICSLERFRYWLRNEDFGYEGEDLEDSTEWEIIGNLYENPEKLTK